MIDRQAAIDLHCDLCSDKGFCGDICPDVEAFRLIETAEPERNLDEWCTGCKEYDTERKCCPRWNRVIRQTIEEAKRNAQYERGEEDLVKQDPEVKTGIFDVEEVYPNCTVQIWKNSVTGEKSVGWWKNG